MAGRDFVPIDLFTIDALLYPIQRGVGRLSQRCE
jgi:hypothetical protein